MDAPPRFVRDFSEGTGPSVDSTLFNTLLLASLRSLFSPCRQSVRQWLTIRLAAVTKLR